MLDVSSISVFDNSKGNLDAITIFENDQFTSIAIADGKSSQDIADLIIDTFRQDLDSCNEITTSTLPRIFQHAQDELLLFQQKNLSPGIATAAIFLTDGDIALWAHIGDCRIYHLQDNLLYEITADHSLSYLRYEAGDIRYPFIRTDRFRQELTHAMGMNQSFQPTFSSPTKIRKNDCFLLCTDGFWENIHERKIERFLKRSKNAAEWLSKMQHLVEKNRGRKKYTKIPDDYSAITIYL